MIERPPDPDTIRQVADWIELSAGRVRGLSQASRGLLAEYLRDGSWTSEPERKNARARRDEIRPYVAQCAGRGITYGEADAYKRAMAAVADRAANREAKERATVARIAAQLRDGMGGVL